MAIFEHVDKDFFKLTVEEFQDILHPEWDPVLRVETEDPFRADGSTYVEVGIDEAPALRDAIDAWILDVQERRKGRS